MAINFNNLTGDSSAATEVTPVSHGISLNLEKNSVLDLAKVEPGLK